VSAQFPDLMPGENLLSPGDELVLRNVHPHFYDHGVRTVSSQAFEPNSGDGGCMSAARETVVSPMDSYMEYTITFGLSSAGIWALTTEEVSIAGSRTVDDCGTQVMTGDRLPTGHAYVDFRDLGGSGGREGRRAKKLKAQALTRGCMYLSPDYVAS
jgi:hypothetical protein